MDERQEPQITENQTEEPEAGTQSQTDGSGVENAGTGTGTEASTASSTPIPRNKGLKSSLIEAWHGPRRPILILVGIAILVLIIGLIDLLTSGHRAPPPNDVAPAAPKHAGMVGGQAPAPYQQAAHAENATQAAQAEQQGETYMPPMGELQKTKPIPVAAPVQSAPPPAPAPAAPVRPAYGAYPYQDAMNKEIRAITKGMMPVAALTANVTTKMPGTPGSMAPGMTAATASTTSAVKPAPVILAEPGHISFAVLDTSIKSTEPGPVMATIEDGRFAGAKLLGGYVRHAGRVVVEFNEMTLHHQSYPIQAVAITTQTARTALSTYTNYHVLYRYGWLIGSALLEGVSNAVQSANTSTYITGSGLGVVSQQLSNGQIAASAIGNIGTVLAPIMAQRFLTPPTVHVAAGTGVGILFMKPVAEGVQR